MKQRIPKVNEEIIVSFRFDFQTNLESEIAQMIVPNGGEWIIHGGASIGRCSYVVKKSE